MLNTGTRLILAFLSITAIASAAAAQERRPAETRAVPIDLVCAPQAALALPSQAFRITGGPEPSKALFAAGDTVFINAGTAQGLEPGQHYFARRIVEDRFALRTTESIPRSVHTGGWITIIEAQTDTSTAKVAEACDGVIEGDYLEALALPPVAVATDGGAPDFERPARVILADDRRQLGTGGGSLMVLDRGTDHGLRPGQRLTVFRRALNGSGPVVEIGDAFIATTYAETSLIRIQKSREEVKVGDLVAIHR